jgi:hypothetical protein
MRVPLGLRLSMLGQQSVASGVGGGIGLAAARVAAVARTRGRAKRMLVVGSVDMWWRAVGWRCSCNLYARACEPESGSVEVHLLLEKGRGTNLSRWTSVCTPDARRHSSIEFLRGGVGDGLSVC